MLSNAHPYQKGCWMFPLTFRYPKRHLRVRDILPKCIQGDPVRKRKTTRNSHEPLLNSPEVPGPISRPGGSNSALASGRAHLRESRLDEHCPTARLSWTVSSPQKRNQTESKLQVQAPTSSLLAKTLPPKRARTRRPRGSRQVARAATLHKKRGDLPETG